MQTADSQVSTNEAVLYEAYRNDIFVQPGTYVGNDDDSDDDDNDTNDNTDRYHSCFCTHS